MLAAERGKLPLITVTWKYTEGVEYGVKIVLCASISEAKNSELTRVKFKPETN